jgi:hypothetical protein
MLGARILLLVNRARMRLPARALLGIRLIVAPVVAGVVLAMLGSVRPAAGDARTCEFVPATVGVGERLEIHANGDLIGTDIVWPSVTLTRSDGRNEAFDDEIRMPDNAWWVVVQFESDDAGRWTAELTLPSGDVCIDELRVGVPDTSAVEMSGRPFAPLPAVIVLMGAVLGGLAFARRIRARSAA